MQQLLSSLSVAVAAIVAGPALAQNHPITTNNAGAPIVVTGSGDIIATYLGTSAAYTDILFLENTNTQLFNNQTTPVGTTFNLGSFAVGTELRFRLFVTDTNTNWFSGVPSRNSDGLGHAAVQSDYLVPGTTLVSFEDLPDSQEFNDLSFSFSGTTAGAVPEASTWAMMMLGFVAIGGAMRVRRRGATIRLA